MHTYHYDWSDVAFGSKKGIDALGAIFIAAPRELSLARFTQLVKTYLPKGNIVLGLAKESHVLGFEAQPQFRMLQREVIEKIIARVNASPSKYKIYTLSYFQRETKHVFEKLTFHKILLVNGSWKYAFHTQEPYYVLANRHIEYEMISPFTDEAEAREYEARIMPELQSLIPKVNKKALYSELEMLALAEHVAKLSFDSTFQTGAVLGTKKGKGYQLLTYGYNAVLPYQTHAMHYGASREKHFSPPNDLNHYDTNHAEVNVMLTVLKARIDITDTTLFVNLMPCPTCARMLSQTAIAEIVCAREHSAGYAVDLLGKTGKIVRHISV